MLRKDSPYFSLWNGIISKRSTHSSNRVSNAPKENFFGHGKNNILSGDSNVKVLRLVRKLREYVICKETEMF